MNPPPDSDEVADPSGPLGLIDQAVEAVKRAAHACRSVKAREHFEFALALLRESWIAESGQEARGAERVIADVKWTLNLFASVCGEEGL